MGGFFQGHFLCQRHFFRKYRPYNGAGHILIDVAFKEKIGIGTILNTVLIGQFTDFFIAADIVPKADNFWLGVVMMLAGQFLLSIGSYFYIKTALGCGPRDSLMVALAKMAGRLPVGAVRGLIEGSVLLIGWLLGAKIGAGTVIAVFGIGLILEWTFRMFSFDVKSVVHESVFDSFARIRSAARRENG
jgi:uncharacterized membrane protein YczE